MRSRHDRDTHLKRQRERIGRRRRISTRSSSVRLANGYLFSGGSSISWSQEHLVFLQFGPFFEKSLQLDLWKTQVQKWTQGVGAMHHGAEVSRLDAMDHGAEVLDAANIDSDVALEKKKARRHRSRRRARRHRSRPQQHVRIYVCRSNTSSFLLSSRAAETRLLSSSSLCSLF